MVMAWFQGRVDRLRQIVAELVRRNVTPDSNNFADWVQTLVASFGLSTSVAKDYIATLIRAWRYLKWKPFIEYNDYLTDEEKKAWFEKYGIKG
jgi:hypothetical protein